MVDWRGGAPRRIRKSGTPFIFAVFVLLIFAPVHGFLRLPLLVLFRLFTTGIVLAIPISALLPGLPLA